eukprot:COSAG06_NODE_5098_length_3717_cov_15.451907_5_plen_46_part_01
MTRAKELGGVFPAAAHRWRLVLPGCVLVGLQLHPLEQPKREDRLYS